MAFPLKPTAVVCDDQAGMRRAVGMLLDRCGFDLVALTEDFQATRNVVAGALPDLVVLALPVPGSDGLPALDVLRAVAPRCAVVVLSSFGALESAALQSGARALVGEDDLRALEAVLVDVVTEVRRRQTDVAASQAACGGVEGGAAGTVTAATVSTKPAS